MHANWEHIQGVYSLRCMVTNGSEHKLIYFEPYDGLN